MKGQQEALTAILITGVLIGVVGTVYFWGVPLIEKNKDVSILENSEFFMKNLNERIKYIANNGGKDQIKVTVPGIIRFSSDKTIELAADTKGTIYNVNAEIPLGKNTECYPTDGIWGLDDMEIICVKSVKIGETSYNTTYYLSYRNLTSGSKKYVIDLTGNPGFAGEEHFIGVENKGTSVDANLIRTIIEINIV
jgi:hypothetical protein